MAEHLPKPAVIEEQFSWDGNCVGSLEQGSTPVSNENFVADWEGGHS